MIDHQLAVEMIILVLNRDRQKPVGFELEGLAVRIEGAHLDAFCAVDVFTDAWEGETTLVEGGFPFGFDDLRIDEDAKVTRLVFPCRDVHDEKSLRNPELGSGQTNPRSGVHRLGHVLDQLAQLGVELLDFLAGIAETFVWVKENRAKQRVTSERLAAQHLGTIVFSSAQGGLPQDPGPVDRCVPLEHVLFSRELSRRSALMAEWDRTVDLLVMGSGAAGMSGAIRAHDLGLDVLLVEKSDLFGGNTAMSGGVCWVPNNPGMGREGIADSDEEGFTYLKHITKGEVADERLWLYIRESKRVLAYLQENTHVRYVPLTKYTDYYPEAPGGRSGGRSMDPVPFDGSKLREDLIQLRRPHPQSQILGKFGITAREAQAAIGVGFRTMLFMAWQMFLYVLRYPKRTRWGRDTKLCAGNSLMGRFLLSLKERDIPAWLHTSVEELIFEDGRVVGAILDKEGKRLRIKTNRGVLIAAGGFSRNLEMREKYQRHPISTEWTAGTPSNTGDGIILGQKAGGALDLMDEAWWTPVSLVPKSPFSWVLVVEKSLPHGLFVNQDGKRFTNEAAPYIDVVNGMYEDVAKTRARDPRWYHIFDATYRRSSIEGPIAPGKVMPDERVPRRYRDGNYLFRASTLEELAEQIRVPAASLRATITRFNENAIRGEDPDYNRGWSAQDRYYGDPRVKPNCSLGPIETGPFYAVRIYPGDLGTKGGLRTDDHGRVLKEDGQAVPGLYAAGNSTASMMGRTYPGAGGTIGPALTFGFLAAEAAEAFSESATKISRDFGRLGVAESAS